MSGSSVGGKKPTFKKSKKINSQSADSGRTDLEMERIEFERARRNMPRDQRAFSRAKLCWYGVIARDPEIWRKGKAVLPVAWQLVEHLNLERGYAWPGIERLATVIGASKTSVIEALKHLRITQWIFANISRRRGNWYAINLEKVQLSGHMDYAKGRAKACGSAISTAGQTTEAQPTRQPVLQPAGQDTSYSQSTYPSYGLSPSANGGSNAHRVRDRATREAQRRADALEKIQQFLNETFGTETGYQIGVLLDSEAMAAMVDEFLRGILSADNIEKQIPEELLTKAGKICKIE